MAEKNAYKRSQSDEEHEEFMQRCRKRKSILETFPKEQFHLHANQRSTQIGGKNKCGESKTVKLKITFSEGNVIFYGIELSGNGREVDFDICMNCHKDNRDAVMHAMFLRILPGSALIIDKPLLINQECQDFFYDTFKNIDFKGAYSIKYL